MPASLKRALALLTGVLVGAGFAYGAQQVVNVATQGSGQGDTAFVAFSKLNANLAELYGLTTPLATNQPAGVVMAGPVTGSATPTFRALLSSDLPPIVSGGSPVVVNMTGCGVNNIKGGANSGSRIATGSFKGATSGTCNITMTFPPTTNSWACTASDLTSPVVFVQIGALSTTTCTITAITVSGDTMTYMAMGS